MKHFMTIVYLLPLILTASAGHRITLDSNPSPKYPSITDKSDYQNPFNVLALFIFGDSLTDAGTNQYLDTHSDFLANFPPYGMTFFHNATGRFTNGRTAVDFIAYKLGLDFVPSFLRDSHSFTTGFNFASAGSGALAVTNQGRGTVALSNQIQQFVNWAKSKKQPSSNARSMDYNMIEDWDKLISESVYIIDVGGNDMLEAMKKNQTLSLYPDDIIDPIINSVGESIEVLYSYGARKFIMMGLGPIGCIPSVKAYLNMTDALVCQEILNDAAELYNNKFSSLVKNATSDLTGVNMVLAKTHQTILSWIKNGTIHGYTEGTNACCGLGVSGGDVQCGTTPTTGPFANQTTMLCDNVVNHVFWDYYHPTERVHQDMVDLWWEGSTDVIEPMSLKKLFSL